MHYITSAGGKEDIFAMCYISQTGIIFKNPEFEYKLTHCMTHYKNKLQGKATDRTLENVGWSPGSALLPRTA